MSQASAASQQNSTSKQNSLQPAHQQLTHSHSAPPISQYPAPLANVRLPKGIQQHQVAALAQQWGRQPLKQPAPVLIPATRAPDQNLQQLQPQLGRGPITVSIAATVGGAPQQASAKSPRSGVARQLFTQPAGKAVTTVTASRPVQSSCIGGPSASLASSSPAPSSMSATIPVQTNMNSSFQPKMSEGRPGLIAMPSIMMASQGQVHVGGEQVPPGMQPPQLEGNRSAPVSSAQGGFNFLAHMVQTPGNAFGWTSLADRGSLKEEGTKDDGGSFPNSEEAKAPGYKRLSAGSMPVGDASLLSTVTSLHGSQATFNAMQAHYLHQHQAQAHPLAPSNPHPHSVAQHSLPHPIERPDGGSNSMPHGHANLAHFSPISNPPAPSPTPPNANTSPISPGTSPRSGTTSPSTSAASQDRKLPRPIGTERHRQQNMRRTPVGFPDLPNTSASSIWAFQPG